MIAPRRFDASDSFNQSNPLLDLDPGEYTLRVDATVDNVGDFAFRVLDLKAAIPVVAETAFSGELTVPNETDLYQFNASAGDQFLVDVESASDTSDTLYRIVDPFGNILEEQGSLADRDLLPFSTSGTYTILVEGWRANVDQDTYTINLRRQDVRDAGNLTLGARTVDSITQPNEEVAYSFTLGSDSFVHFDSFTNRGDLVWSLTGPRGIEYSNVRFDRSDSVFTSNTSSPSVAYELLAGDYTLTISGTLAATGDFDFAIRNLSDPSQSTVVSDPVLGLPTTIVDTQSDASETRIYRFDATAGDQLSFDSTPTGSITSDYRLLDAFGRQVFTRALVSDQAAVTVGLTGTYYLLIEGRPTNADPDAINLTITHEGNTPVPAFSGTALTLGTITSGNLATADQVDAYTFRLASRSLLNFDALTNNVNLRWRLTGPRGTELLIGASDNLRFTQSDSFGTTNGAVAGRSFVAGDYQLEIFGTTGPYSFRLNNLADALAITPGTDVVDQLDPANGTKLYKFDATAGQRFLVDVKAVSYTHLTLPTICSV